MNALPSGWLTVPEAAARYGLSKATIYRLIASGEWPSSVLPGVRARRFSPADLEQIERRSSTRASA
jgi:excisionase family DNA binding protein